MYMKYGDIVEYKNQIGMVVQTNNFNDYRFLPYGQKAHAFMSLDSITDHDVRKLTNEETIEFFKNNFKEKDIIAIHCINAYQIIESYDKNRKQSCFTGYVYLQNKHNTYNAYKDIGTYMDLDSALIECIVRRNDCDGERSMAGKYFRKIVNIH